MKLFQVKPDKLEQFEAKIEEMTANQFKCEGCISLKYFKRFAKIADFSI
jgi:quinol monooxygenase YgiN